MDAEQALRKAQIEHYWKVLSQISVSIGNLLILKGEAEKGNHFSSDAEKADFILLIDEIIWEESNAAREFREMRKELMAFAAPDQKKS